MEPVFKAGRAYCPTCEWGLKLDADGAACGICGARFTRAELAVVERKHQSPEERRLEDLERAKALLAATEEDKGAIGVVSMDDHHAPQWKKVFSLLGMPVEEESYATGEVPWVSLTFVGLCLLIFAKGDSWSAALQLDSTQLMRAGGLNFVTYALVHADIWHLVGNLFFLWPFMDNVEEHLGRERAVIFIVLSAIGSAAAHLAVSYIDGTLVGASGVCFGVATLYCLRYPKNRFLISIPFVGLLAFRRRLRVRAWVLFVYYIAFELFGAFEQQAGLTDVSHWGHVGGALMGWFFYRFTRDVRDV